jgi:preprotein translocase SecE subunit
MLLLAIGVHLGYYAYERVATAVTDGGARQWVVGGIYAVCALIALLGGIIAAGFHQRAVDFLIEVEGEMTRVEWPQWNSLWRSTLIIAVAVAVLSLLLFLVDGMFFKFVGLLTEIGKRLF